MQPSFDTRRTVDCKYFLIGCCTKGDSCPFLHDPAKISLVRGQQGQLDCTFYLQGRCAKGSLCPYKHDEAKLRAVSSWFNGQGAGSTAFSSRPAVPTSSGVQQQPVTIDFGVGSASPDEKSLGFGTVRQSLAGSLQPHVSAAPAASVSLHPPALPRRHLVDHAPGAHLQPSQKAEAICRVNSQKRTQIGIDTGREERFPTRLVDRLGQTSPSEANVDEGRRSPKKMKMSRSSDHEEPQSRQQRATAQRQLPRRTGGLGVAVAALYGVLGKDPPVTSAPEQGQRIIVLEEEKEALHRRRRPTSDEQSVKFVLDEKPPATSPARATERRGRGLQKPSGKSVLQRLTPAPAVQAQALGTAAPLPKRVAHVSATDTTSIPSSRSSQQQEDRNGSKSSFQPPKSLHELRKVRKHGSRVQEEKTDNNKQELGSQTTANTMRKHKPILWQPEAAAATVTEGGPIKRASSKQEVVAPGPHLKQDKKSQDNMRDGKAEERTPVMRGNSDYQNEAVAQAVVTQAERSHARKPEQEEEVDDEEFDYGGDGAEDFEEDMEDFEAQLRALEEQL